MRKIHQKRIYRADLKANPDVIYLFGDNLLEVGMGGQAGEMRGEANAIGIPTKKTPAMDDRAFFSDAEFEQNRVAIDRALQHVVDRILGAMCPIVVIPLDGLGTGLAELDVRAPRTFAYLEESLAEL